MDFEKLSRKQKQTKKILSNRPKKKSFNKEEVVSCVPLPERTSSIGIIFPKGSRYRKSGVLVKTNDIHIHSMEYYANIKNNGETFYGLIWKDLQRK